MIRYVSVNQYSCPLPLSGAASGVGIQCGNSLEVDPGGGTENVLLEVGDGVKHRLDLLSLAGVDVEDNIKATCELLLEVRVIVAITGDMLDLRGNKIEPLK